MDPLLHHDKELQEALLHGSWKVPRYPCGEKLTAAQYKTRYITRYIEQHLSTLDFNDPEALFLEALQDLLHEYHTSRISWKIYASKFHDLLQAQNISSEE